MLSGIPKLYDAFYFHPDHLGSSSYISNLAGNVSQHIEYMPFGEMLVDEHINSFNTPFKFNGKEYDEETGNYFYGARYYDPKWSIFISVDPLAEQTMSSYGYCYNSPNNYVDPTGMEADGWITTLKADGNKAHTYNSSINSCEEAIAAGYDINNLEGVYESIKVSANDGSYSFNLNADGTVTNALWGDVPVTMGPIYGTDSYFLRTEGGSDISTNKLAIDTRTAQGNVTAMGFSSPFFPMGMVMNSALGNLGRAISSEAAMAEASVASGTTSNVVRYSGYTGFDKGGIMRYVGITSRNTSIRIGKHIASNTERASLQFRAVKTATSMTKAQARAWEQRIINANGLQKNGGVLYNKINSIAPSKWAEYGIK